MPWRLEFSARHQRAYLYNPDTRESKWPAATVGAAYDARPAAAPPPCRAMAACRRRHNMWKRQLVDAHVPRRAAVLDLACGRGGDLQKFAHRHPRRLVGYDVSALSLAEARRRATLLPKLPAEFVVADLRRPWPDDGGQLYDAATCFFALHYFCGSADTVRHFARSLRCRLRTGAPLVTIVPDVGRLRYPLPEFMEVVDLPPGDLRLGDGYRFRFGDRVPGDAVEYVVPLPVLEEIMGPWFALESVAKHAEEVPETQFYVAVVWRAVAGDRGEVEGREGGAVLDAARDGGRDHVAGVAGAASDAGDGRRDAVCPALLASPGRCHDPRVGGAHEALVLAGDPRQHLEAPHAQHESAAATEPLMHLRGAADLADGTPSQVVAPAADAGIEGGRLAGDEVVGGAPGPPGRRARRRRRGQEPA